MLEDKKAIDLCSNTVTSYNTLSLRAGMGYKFQTRAFLEIAYLYLNSVDPKNPDLLGKQNKNTFVNEIIPIYEKINEQTRLDTRDINFSIHSASSLARFIPKAANRKFLRSNNFATQGDEHTDIANWFGSSFQKTWTDAKGELKLRTMDPLKLIWNPYNFTKGPKIEKLRRSYRDIIADEKYNPIQRASLGQGPSRHLWYRAICRTLEHLRKVVREYE